MIEQHSPCPRPYADITELLELGVLQEANRRFFHILGLSHDSGVEV